MNEHILHYAFSVFPFILILVILLRKIRFSSKFQLFSVFTLVFFIFLHIAPYSTVFAHHHQATSPSAHHPCCIPQSSTAPETFIVHTVIEIKKQPEELKPIVHEPVFLSTYTPRAPPFDN